MEKKEWNIAKYYCKTEKKPESLGKDLAKLLKVFFNSQSKVIRNFQSQVNSLQSELHTLARAQVEAAELLQQQEEDLERERIYSDELKKKLRVSDNLLTTVIGAALTSEPQNDIRAHNFGRSSEISVILNNIYKPPLTTF